MYLVGKYKIVSAFSSRNANESMILRGKKDHDCYLYTISHCYRFSFLFFLFLFVNRNEEFERVYDAEVLYESTCSRAAKVARIPTVSREIAFSFFFFSRDTDI